MPIGRGWLPLHARSKSHDSEKEVQQHRPFAHALECRVAALPYRGSVARRSGRPQVVVNRWLCCLAEQRPLAGQRPHSAERGQGSPRSRWIAQGMSGPGCLGGLRQKLRPSRSLAANVLRAGGSDTNRTSWQKTPGGSWWLTTAQPQLPQGCDRSGGTLRCRWPEPGTGPLEVLIPGPSSGPGRGALV